MVYPLGYDNYFVNEKFFFFAKRNDFKEVQLFLQDIVHMIFRGQAAPRVDASAGTRMAIPEPVCRKYFDL
jgi:hypothetical protein